MPGDCGNKFYPQGYLIDEMGPKAFEGKGKEQMARTKELLKREQASMCPFR
jgi:hypothetical protein